MALWHGPPRGDDNNDDGRRWHHGAEPARRPQGCQVRHRAGAGEDTPGNNNMQHARAAAAVAVVAAAAARCQERPSLLVICCHQCQHRPHCTERRRPGGAPLSCGRVVVAFKSDDECDIDDDDDEDDNNDDNDGIVGVTGVGLDVGAKKRVVCARVYFISWPDWLF
jgi:hypothetical protein